jgi:FkbM family methyltransferase
MKDIVRQAAAMLGLRIVNARWGPRGFGASFADAKSRGFTPAAVIDVGAAEGTWTQECLSVFPDAKYLLVDPLPANVSKLEALAAAHPNVAWWGGAVGPMAGTLKLFEHGDQTSAFEGPSFPGPVIEVEQRTLDNLTAEKSLTGPLILKLDVQGMELEVLKGAVETLRRTELVLAELNILYVYEGGCLAQEVIGFLAEHGFQIFDICSYAQRPRDGMLAQSDFLFVKRDSALVRERGW